MPRLLGTTTYQIEIKWDGANWTDETARVREFSIERGRDENVATVRAGRLFLRLNDPERFNPGNAASALQPYIARPLREVRVRATYSSVTYDLFTGYTRRHEANPAPDAQVAEIEANDGFLLLDGNKPTIASDTTTTGAAIAAILTAAGFGGATDLDTGDAITFEADGTAGALQLIADLLTAERGFFFFAADGTATYLDRYATNRSPYTSSQATVSDTMSALAATIDYDQIYNRATVTATGGTAQTHSDTGGALGSVLRDFPAITSDYLGTDAQALSLAKFIVMKRKDGVIPIRYLDLSNGKDAPFAALLARELGDRITIADSLGGTSGDYHIQSVIHEVNWSAQIHRGTWRLLARDSVQPFLIGISEIGGDDVITY